MRIAFLCGGLGLGGVADYTRNLAAQLRPLGVESLAIGLNDRDIGSRQAEQAPGWEALALPEALPWPERIGAAEQALARFRPDWLSLQFVPYAFNRKGVVALEGRWLQRLASERRLHVMMHELWVEPLPRAVPFRRTLVRAAQRAAILRLLRRLRSSAIHTSNAVYRELLAREGFAAELLPLFGNVPLMDAPDRGWLEPALADAGADPSARPLLFGFFGGIAPDWDANGLFARLTAALAKLGRQGLILSAGAAGPVEAMMAQWRRRHPALRFYALGVQPGERISTYLQALDFGLSSYPYALVGKSSSIMAMLEHGLPVILSWGDLGPDLPAVASEDADLIFRPGGDLEGFIANPPPRRLRGSRLPAVAESFLAELVPAAAREGGDAGSRSRLSCPA